MKDRPEFHEDDEGPFVRLYPTGTLGVDYRLPVPPDEGPIDHPVRRSLLGPPRATADPARITMALDVNMLDGPLVDVACGTVEPAVDEWETGDRVPSEEQVRRLATLTGYPIAFFYAPEPVPDLGTSFACGPSGCVVREHPRPKRREFGVVCPTCGHVGPPGLSTAPV